MKAATTDHHQRSTAAKTSIETVLTAPSPPIPAALTSLLRAATVDEALERALAWAAQLSQSCAVGIQVRRPALKRGESWPGAALLTQRVVSEGRVVRVGPALGLPICDNSGYLLGALLLGRCLPERLAETEQLAACLGLTLERLLLRRQLGDLEERGARLSALGRVLDSCLTLQRKADAALSLLKTLCGFQEVLRVPLTGPPADFPAEAEAEAAPQLRSLWGSPWGQQARQTLDQGERVLGRWHPLEGGPRVLVIGLRAQEQLSEAWLLLGCPQQLAPGAGDLLRSAARRIENGLTRQAQRQSQRRRHRRGSQAHRRQTELLTELPLLLEQAATPEQMAERGLGVLLSLGHLDCGAYLQLDSLTGALHAHLYAAPASTFPASPPTPALDEAQSAALIAAARQVISRQRPVLKSGPELPCVLTPLRCKGRTVGALALCQPSGAWPPEPNVIKLLKVVARRVGAALERRETLSELSQTREQALYLLGQTLGYRSSETKGHTERVTALALRLGVALDLDFGALGELRWGAYLHDIGKIAIPDALLLKAGPLSDAEKEQMSVHVTLGEQMLRAQGFVPEAVCQVVRHHHERWDGGGYPDGLAAEAIPLLARVFAVADVYDALVSARSYKPHWSRARALAELRRAAGTHLDPLIVSRFTELMESGPRNAEPQRSAGPF